MLFLIMLIKQKYYKQNDKQLELERKIFISYFQGHFLSVFAKMCGKISNFRGNQNLTEFS